MRVSPLMFQRAFAFFAPTCAFVTFAFGQTTVAPVIHGIPASRSVISGADLLLMVSATGAPPLTFEWRFNGAVVATTTSGSYVIANAQSSHAGSYVVTVANHAGSTTSAAFTVTVAAPSPPSISLHPVDRVVEIGRGLELDVSVGGALPIMYQWFKDGSAIPGATSSSYDKPVMLASDVGAYTVTASNALGSITSSPARVTLRPLAAPSFTAFSSNTVVPLGDRFTLHVSPSGNPPMMFQWFRDGAPLAGETNQRYEVAASEVAHVGAYQVLATSPLGTATTSSMTLGVSLPQPVAITQHPASVAVTAPESPSLSVAVTGARPIAFQWRRDGVPLPNATNGTYSPPIPTGSDSASYTVVVSNAFATVVSEPATVTARQSAAPLAALHPANRVVVAGASLSLSGAFSGTAPMLYQWFKDGSPIAGATRLEYFKSPVSASDAGVYSVSATNAVDTRTTRNATVAVLSELAPVILRHPESIGIAVNGGGSLSVTVRSGSSLRYQWRKEGVAIAGATSSSVVVSGQPDSAGTYDVVVTNFTGAATSRGAVVTVESAQPFLFSTPGSVAIPLGATVSFPLGLNSSSASVAWRKDGVPIPTSPGSSLQLSRVGLGDYATYTAVVTSSGGALVTSRPIVVEQLDRDVRPRVTQHPAAQDRQAGFGASFAVTAEGELPLTYQWRKDGVPIGGATASEYSIANLTTEHGGDYSVVITNRVGSVTSDAVPLTVRPIVGSEPPAIRSQPASIALMRGASSSALTVSVSSTAPVKYQWFKDGALLDGRTGASLEFFSSASAIASAIGRYYVVVSHDGASVTSAVANVTELENRSAPSLSRDPAGATVLPGSAVTLEAAVEGSVPLSFQWRKRGVPIADATNATLLLSHVQPSDAGVYTLIASNAAGIVSSRGAELLVRAPKVGPPVATTEPRSTTALPGATVTLTAGFAANPEAMYQWRKDGTAIAGATSPALILAPFSSTNVGRYTAVATNAYGSASSAEAVVAMGTPIVFDAVPAAQSVPAGSALTLAPRAQGGGALTYQWKKDGVVVPGATGATLSFSALQPQDAGRYTLVAMNRDGALESPAMILTVMVSPQAGVYVGTFGGPADIWALSVGADGVGTFVGHVPGRNQAVVVRAFRIAADGSFRGIAGTRFGTTLFTGEIAGAIKNGAVTGEVIDAGLIFVGAATPASGPTAALSGYYHAVGVGSSLEETHLIVGADGVVHFVALNGGTVLSGRGSANLAGTFSVVQAQFVASGTVRAGARGFDGSLQTAGGGFVALATPAAPGGMERLANVSTRGVAGSGSRTLIAGFVVTGDEPKEVLVRGVGPALRAFGVSTALANPRLQIFRGESLLADNDDWSVGGSGAEIVAAAARLGAFPLAGGSGDAALLARLAPGGYTAQLTSDANATGVALVEVYDASASGAEKARLINLSTRGDVGMGADILIVGLVVAGEAPRKLMLRGVGPALAGFGVAGALADPQLQLYLGARLVRDNDNWSSGPDARLVAEAAEAVGAFALPNGSRDAALLLYLAPGSYTAQLSGVGNATGVGLIEVYEVP